MAHYKDLTYVAVDVGCQAHHCIAAWRDGLLSTIARRIMLGKNQELCVIAFGSNTTLNELSDTPDYQGIEVVCGLKVCSADMYTKVQARIVPSTGPADYVSALLVALDDLKRQKEARKLHTSRKSIWIVSPFLDATEPLNELQIREITSVCVDSQMRVSINVAVALWPPTEGGSTPPAPSQLPAAVAANVEALEALHAAGVAGHVATLQQPCDFQGLVQAQPTFMSTSLTLKVHEFEVEMKAYSLAMKNRLPAAQLYSDTSTGVDATHTVKRETTWHVAGNDGVDKEVPPEIRKKMYRFGNVGFPAADDIAYKWKEQLSDTNPLKQFKGLQVLAFIDASAPLSDIEQDVVPPDVMPRWAYQGSGQVLMPATQKAAAVTAALVTAMLQSGKHALVRYAPRANSAIYLGVLVPVEGSKSDIVHVQRDAPSHFILQKASYGGDFRRISMSALSNCLDDIGLDEGLHIAPMDANITSMTDTSAGAHFLSDTLADPMLCRFDTTVVETGIAVMRSAASGASSSTGTARLPTASASELKDAVEVKPLEADALAQRLLFPDQQQALAAKQTMEAAFGRLEVAAEAPVPPGDVKPEEVSAPS